MLISANSASHAYEVKGFPPVYALKSVTISDIEPGELIFVLGDNAAGKSTLIKKLAGRLPSRVGEGEFILGDGRSISFQDTRSLSRVFIPQRPMEGLVPQLSILENITLRKSLRNIGLRKLLARVHQASDLELILEILRSLGFGELDLRLEQPPEVLSGGQQQLVNFVAAIYAEPQLLLCDEPTSSLDEVNRTKVWSLLVRLVKDHHIPVICATHDHSMARRIADRLVVLENGQVASKGMVRLRRVGDRRFPGAIRLVERTTELHEVPNSDWWRPGTGRLFDEAYFEGDDSRQGYLPDREMTRSARTEREVAAAVRLLKLVPEIDRIIDVPCGWGRHVDVLRRRDFTVFGFDRAMWYLSLAQSRANAAADMRALPIRSGAIGGILNLWTSFGFFDDEGNRETLREWARVLRPGGRLLIHSDLNPLRVRKGLFDERPVRSLQGGGTLEVTETYCAENGRVYGSWTVGRDDEVESHSYSIAVYSPEDWTELASHVDLDVIEILGGLDDEAGRLTAHSLECVLVLEKR